MNTTSHKPLFDRALLNQRKRRHALRFLAHDFLYAETAARLGDRLEMINRTFEQVLVLGDYGLKGHEKLAQSQITHAHLDPATETLKGADGTDLAPQSYDLILSNMVLHWVNDLPGVLVQMRLALKPDGLLVAGLVGGGSLAELRHCLIDAELETTGGAGLRVPPFTDVRDAGHLLQRAGFAMPVADMDPLDVRYRNPLSLLDDLRYMGEANIMIDRATTPLRRDTLVQFEQFYRTRHSDADGLCPASFNLLFLTAWAPSPDQPKAKAPGSATHSLKDVLKSKI